MQKPFNAIIESILLKRCMHYLFYAPTIGLYMLEPSAMDVLGKVVPLASVKQIQVDIGNYRGDITHKFNIQEEDNPKKTLEYIGTTEPGHIWYNYIILNNLPDVPEDNFT